MKVSGVGGTSGPAQVKRAGKADKSKDTSFAEQLGEGADAPAETHSIDAPAAVASVDALLATQAVGDDAETAARKRLVRRGEDILDRLEELRHALLIGSIPKDKLIALAQMVRSRRDQVADPRLSSLLGEIELRAEVELAKLSRRST